MLNKKLRQKEKNFDKQEKNSLMKIEKEKKKIKRWELCPHFTNDVHGCYDL